MRAAAEQPQRSGDQQQDDCQHQGQYGTAGYKHRRRNPACGLARRWPCSADRHAAVGHFQEDQGNIIVTGALVGQCDQFLAAFFPPKAPQRLADLRSLHKVGQAVTAQDQHVTRQQAHSLVGQCLLVAFASA